MGAVAREQFIFDSVTNLTAVAVGEPGKRTFYLVVGQGERWVRGWLEKQELQALALTIQQLLAEQSPEEAAGDASVLVEPLGSPSAEYRVGRLGLAHDPPRDRIIMLVHEHADDTAGGAAVQCWATREQMRSLSLRIEEVCAAGRPVCPLCSAPIDPEGHACIRSNGHPRARP